MGTKTLRRFGLAKSGEDPAAARAAVNLVSLRALLGEDPTFIAELAHAFESNGRELVVQMQAAAAGGRISP